MARASGHGDRREGSDDAVARVREDVAGAPLEPHVGAAGRVELERNGLVNGPVGPGISPWTGTTIDNATCSPFWVPLNGPGNTLELAHTPFHRSVPPTAQIWQDVEAGFAIDGRHTR